MDNFTKEEIIKLKELLVNSEHAHTKVNGFFNANDPWKFRDFDLIFAILNGVRDEIPKMLRAINDLRCEVEKLKGEKNV
jgi:hypothetical protein